LASSLFILGGARSGKSRFAVSGLPARGRITFVATAEAGDGDMAARIGRHQASARRTGPRSRRPATSWRA
jgi:adenosylcobinamide kinase/adenosylcobinamide-phosphate guanylyltransferase